MPVRKPVVIKNQRMTSSKKKKITNIGEEVNCLLEHGTLESLQRAKQLSQDHLKHQWDFYSELAFQRNAVVDKLIDVISESCIEDYKFSTWQRVLQWKYTNHPLCTIGSLKQYGGRFNIGEDISPSGALQTFPAFYIAQDQVTAKAEAFGSQVPGFNLSAEEVALVNKRSYGCISISGSLDRVIDLTKKSSLTKFIRLISKFKIPQSIFNSALRLNLPPPTLINSTALLLDSFLASDWRKEPAQFDIPANGQIFGQLVHKAGIDGILFKSSKTKELCLAIFPSNFSNGNSFLQLDDEPPENWIVNHIDSENFEFCQKDVEEVKSLRSLATSKK